MNCECEGTWKHPCAKCYRAQLVRRQEQQALGPTAEELALQLRKADAPGDALEGLKSPLKATPYMTEAARFFKATPSQMRTLVFLGPPGRGKSLAAVWLMRE